MTRAKTLKLKERKPKNLSLSAQSIIRGNELATTDRRDFSAEIEWLIECEYERRKQVKEVA